MLPWLMTLGLALAGPAPTSPAPVQQAPVQLAIDPPAASPSAPQPASAQAPAEGPELPANATSPIEDRAERKRKTKGRRLVIGGATAFGVGMAITWGSAAGAQALGRGRRRRDAVGATLGMAFGGTAMFEGVLLTGLGAHLVGKRAPKNERKSRALRGSGGALMGVGALGLVGTGLMYTRLRERCPAGAACGLAAFQGAGLLLASGAGMVGYAKGIRPHRNHRRLPSKARDPLFAGLGLLGAGYFTSMLAGTAMWTDNDSAQTRRIRNRMYIPVAGPWIVAAGPDVRFFRAALAGGLGLVQIGGAATALVGAIRARHGYEPRVSVVPTGTGATVVGRF